MLPGHLVLLTFLMFKGFVIDFFEASKQNYLCHPCARHSFSAVCLTFASVCSSFNPSKRISLAPPCQISNAWGLTTAPALKHVVVVRCSSAKQDVQHPALTLLTS